MVLGLFASSGLAQCSDAVQSVGEVSVEGLGTALFGNFRTEAERDVVEFYDGVCVTNPDSGWVFLAEEMVVTGLRAGGEIVVDVPLPTVLIDDWRIEAERLRSDGADIFLQGPRFRGPGFAGEAEEILFDPIAFTVTFREVSVAGSQFVAYGSTATLKGETFTLVDAFATTCVCDGDPAYRLRGAGVDIDLGAGVVVVRRGALESGPIRIALGEEVEVSAETLDDLTPPIEIRYVATDPETGTQGTGLEVTISEIGLADGLDLSLGVSGLDGGHALRGTGLLELESGSVEAEFGLGPEGPRFDFVLGEPLADGVRGRFRVRNIEEASASYLHEGLLGLEADLVERRWARGGLGRLTVEGFAAASSQRPKAGQVSGPRLGLGVEGFVRSSSTSMGRFSVRVRVQATEYPTLGARQLGLSVIPAWSLTSGPFTVRVRYTGVLTDGGSPFTTFLDRLVTTRRLNASATVEGALALDVEGRFGVTAVYDFVQGANGLTRWDVEGEVRVSEGQYTLVGDAWMRLEDLADPDRAGLAVGVGAGIERGKFEAGVWAEYLFESAEPGWDEFGVRLALPLGQEEVVVTPFLSLNFAPTILDGEAPVLAGHGLEVEWASCCGTLTVGYRQERNVFNVLLGARF